MKYTGGCHCKKVRFEVEMEIDQLIACNCSMCAKKGHLLTFTPERNFKLLSGEKDLTDYQFYKKNIHHLFCSTCGIASFGKGSMPDGMKMVSINARCLDDVDFTKFQVMHIDGKSF